MSRIFDEGIDFIMKNDKNEQRNFLKIIAKSRYVDVDYLLKLGCFFVPNADYLESCFGNSCYNWELDLYNSEGVCKWVNYVMIPIRDSSNSAVAFIGYNPFSKLIQEENYKNNTFDTNIPPKYIGSSKNCFNRNNYLFVPNGYDRLISGEPLLIVDGTFDALTLGSLGFNVCSNLGSNVSEECMFLMSFTDRRYVVKDNDLAGLHLFNSIKSKLPNTSVINQKDCKDIDEFVLKFGPENVKDKILSSISSKILLPVSL